jgi:hypothetical protein
VKSSKLVGKDDDLIQERQTHKPKQGPIEPFSLSELLLLVISEAVQGLFLSLSLPSLLFFSQSSFFSPFSIFFSSRLFSSLVAALYYINGDLFLFCFVITE